jgi:hypothetical protein
MRNEGLGYEEGKKKNKEEEEDEGKKRELDT